MEGRSQKEKNVERKAMAPPKSAFLFFFPFLLNVARQFSASSRSQSANTKHTHGRIERWRPLESIGESSDVIKHNKARATGKKKRSTFFFAYFFFLLYVKWRARSWRRETKNRGEKKCEDPTFDSWNCIGSLFKKREELVGLWNKKKNEWTPEMLRWWSKTAALIRCV